MKTKLALVVLVGFVIVWPATSPAQTIVDRIPRSDDASFGLNPATLQRPQFRDLDPFFGNSFDERFPEFGRSLSPRVFRHFGHDFVDFDGTPESIDRDLDGVPDVVDPVVDFNDNSFFDPFAGLSPPEIRARGEFLRNQGRGVGARAYGIGTGSGNQAAGFGAYNYGTTAGLGLMYSGMGDYFAGQGQFLSGAGDYEHASSVAAVNREEAQYRDIRNDDFFTTTYFNKRKTNLQARQQEADLRRYAYSSNRPSADRLARLQDLRAPAPLGPDEFDPLTGELNWPAVLKQEEFDQSRDRVDDLFASRSVMGRESGLGTDNYRRVRQSTAQIKADLQENIDVLAPMEYVAAKKFVESVEREAQKNGDRLWSTSRFPAATLAK